MKFIHFLLMFLGELALETLNIDITKKHFYSPHNTLFSIKQNQKGKRQMTAYSARHRFTTFIYQVSVTSILLKYAAILILPIIIAAGGWYFYIASEKQISDNLALGDAIQPGIPKATLILAGNDKQSLTPTYPTPVKVNHSTTAIAQNGALIYPSTPNINIDIPQKQQPETVEKNTLTTEQGNEFRVTFEDGTTVHLNYNTEIRYPVKFSKTKRMVYLKGEAYFKIAKDTRPFYVITDQGIIKQYGTEFNVNTFTSGRTEVALVKGSISIIPQGSTQEQLIEPGQLAHIEQKGNNISIYNVDLTPYIAWNEGRLIFENRTLENIVEILEHWYNVNISFGTSELKQLRFTGNMDRYATISPILKAIARTTNLQIKIEGREILITDN